MYVPLPFCSDPMRGTSPEVVPLEQCTVNSILAFWNYSRSALLDDPDPRRTISAGGTDPITGGPILVEQIMGGVVYNGSEVVSADALKVYFDEERWSVWRGEREAIVYLLMGPCLSTSSGTTWRTRLR